MQSILLSIQAAEGLHARPAHLFCLEAQKYQSEIKLRNTSTGSASVNAKSILTVLTLGVVQGHTIELSASGTDEVQAIQGLKQLVESNFQE